MHGSYKMVEAEIRIVGSIAACSLRCGAQLFPRQQFAYEDVFAKQTLPLERTLYSTWTPLTALCNEASIC